MSKGLLQYPLRKVEWQRRTTGTLMDPSHTILKLECGHTVHVPNSSKERKFCRCDECPKKEST